MAASRRCRPAWRSRHRPDFAPTGDAGDTIATATAITLPVDATIKVPGTVGDGVNGTKDVDLYAITLAAGEQLSVQWSGNLYSQMRFFNAAGQQLGTQSGPYVSPNQAGIVAQFTAPTAGTYYLGITGYPNTSYDPTVAGSGTNASYTGAYSLTLERLQAGGTRLSSISATAGSGTAANAGVASANAGQTITLNGNGLLVTDQLVFTSVDDNGSLFAQTVNPTNVAADGTSLTVVVPNQATTGTVRLAGDPVGLLLQVVPTLTHVDMNINSVFNGGGGTLTGSGFSEGTTTLNFGSSKLVDTARDSNGLDIYNTGHSLNFTAPNGVATGPLSVTTIGGTSAVYGLSFTGITSAPLTGTAATGGQPAANPGQVITLLGSGFDSSTDIVFATVDDSGNKSQIVVHPIATSADGTNATAIVPVNAMTGVVRVVGDLNGNAVPLQIVPTISSITVNSVASDGSSANVTLHGTGFVDGYNTAWNFGSISVLDASSSNQGPDVFSSDTTVNLTVPLKGAFGPISVTTQGGTSAAVRDVADRRPWHSHERHAGQRGAAFRESRARRSR